MIEPFEPLEPLESIEPNAISGAVMSPFSPAHSAIWACIICYHVQAAVLQPLVNVLRDQVGKILLLDNSPEFEGDIAELANSQVLYLPMSHNRGTAGAMNRAWQLALAEGAMAMISFDQDSLPTVTIVAQLSAALTSLRQSGLNPAAVGPGKIDPRNNTTFRLLAPVLPRFHESPSGVAPLVEVDHLITSGCLISAETFKAVGPFREELFLEYVDIEWSLRARSLGYSLYADPRTVMRHTIGDHVIQVGGRPLAVHKPYRCYLLVRNHILLWFLPDTRLYWLLRDLRQVLLKMTLLLALEPNRFERLRSIAKGVWHGLQKRGGSAG
jgi:rhamnosyltransferase